MNLQVGNFVGFFDGDSVGLLVTGAEVGSLVGGAALVIDQNEYHGEMNEVMMNELQ